MNGAMPLVRVICCFILFSHSAYAIMDGHGAETPTNAPANTTAPHPQDCPLNISQVNSYPLMLQQCRSQVDTSHCCESLMYLMEIPLFSWLHTTGSFLLPDEQTSAACFDALHTQVISEGVQDKTFMSCKLIPRQFVSSFDSCNGIHNISGFEAALNTSAMQRYCNGSESGVFECNKCVQSMAIALNQLYKQGPGLAKSSCSMFVILYVGGVINSFYRLGPDVAYCLLSAVDLPALAPTAAFWGKGNVKPEVSHRVAKIAIVIALCTGTFLAVVLSAYACLKWRKIYQLNLKGKKRHESMRKSIDESSGLVFFPLEEIKVATENFSALNVIGEGGFSTIYMGSLSDASQVAVKRFKNLTAKGVADFQHEVQVISSVRHRNLLPLRGFCIEENSEEGTREQLLVYDFMANGSLADYLFRNDRCLSWPEREKIAVGIARGLAYLHDDAKPAIIHRDVKTANILLDAELNPLVADFGLARFKPDHNDDKTHYTTRAVGTLGYVAPEYALYGHLTAKSDVFSFGMVLLELMTGRKVLRSAADNEDHILISDWACDLMQKGMVDEVIDNRIRDSGPRDKMERVILLALQCAHTRVSYRPSIAQAQAILEKIDHPLPEIINNDYSQSCKTERLSWLVSPIVDGRVSYSSVTGNMSLESYMDGR